MSLRKSIARWGVCFLAVLMVWVPTCVQAEMLSTQKALQTLSQNASNRERLTAMVLRKEVQAQLQEFGVSGTEALSRVNSMTDDEVASVIDQIDQYASGGDPVWKASGETEAGHVFMIIVGVIIIGCLSLCWLLFI